jgi:hypothetical protein
MAFVGYQIRIGSVSVTMFLHVYLSQYSKSYNPQFHPLFRFSPRLGPAPDALAVAGIVDGTKSIALRPPAFSASFSFAVFSCAFFRFSRVAHSGNEFGSHSSVDKVVEYWLLRPISAKSISLSIKLGFFRADDCSNLALKWTPFFFSSRNCSNFLLAPGGGEPGGEGGMSKLGTAGSVRSRSIARLAEYGDGGVCVGSDSFTRDSSGGGNEGPSAGPRGVALWIIGPMATGVSGASD